jgi:hypothetical protein
MISTASYARRGAPTTEAGEIVAPALREPAGDIRNEFVPVTLPKSVVSMEYMMNVKFLNPLWCSRVLPADLI